MCDEWRESYLEFYNALGSRLPGTVLDRIDVNGNYEPGNCRWATLVQSVRNKRNVTIPYIEGESAKDRKRRTDRESQARDPEAHRKRCLHYYHRVVKWKQKATV